MRPRIAPVIAVVGISLIGMAYVALVVAAPSRDSDSTDTSQSDTRSSDESREALDANNQELEPTAEQESYTEDYSRPQLPEGYPKLVPDGSPCGFISVDVNSQRNSRRGGIWDINPVGVTCDEAIEVLLPWHKERFEGPEDASGSDEPDGWECDRTDREELMFSVFECTRGNQRISFKRN